MEGMIEVPVAHQVTIEPSPDGKATAMIFKVVQPPGHIAVGLKNAELSRLVGLLISQAAKTAEKHPPEHPSNKLALTPVMASHLGFGRGRADTEAIIAFRVGNLDLSFAVGVSMLHEQCTRLLSMTRLGAPKKKQ